MASQTGARVTRDTATVTPSWYNSDVLRTSRETIILFLITLNLLSFSHMYLLNFRLTFLHIQLHFSFSGMLTLLFGLIT